jgi:hypothetical protein
MERLKTGMSITAEWNLLELINTLIRMLFKETVPNAGIVQHDVRMLTNYLVKGDVIYFNVASQA